MNPVPDLCNNCNRIGESASFIEIFHGLEKIIHD